MQSRGPAPGADRRSPGLRRAGRGANKFLGFALSMAVLAAASLAVIPALIDAGGAAAWGHLAAGQSVGAIAAVVVAFGWGLSGPARIARSDEPQRRREYTESLVTKLMIFAPAALVAAGSSYLLGGDHGALAAAGAVSACSIGLTANWVFVGLGKPYQMLLAETLPRAAGTVVGIVLMARGGGAMVGVLAQLAGMVAAFAVATLWVLRPWSHQHQVRLPRRPVTHVLREQRNGITSSVVSAVYASAPVVMVGLVASTVLPVYALLDKVQRQINAAAAAYVTVLQGWVPRASGGEALRRRVRLALLVSGAGCLLLAGVLAAVARPLLSWLSRGQLAPSMLSMVLMAVIVAVTLFESVASRACLTALDRLDVVARATSIGSAVGVVLLLVGVLAWGVVGALSGVLAGLVLRLAVELVALRRGSRPPTTRSVLVPREASGLA